MILPKARLVRTSWWAVAMAWARRVIHGDMKPRIPMPPHWIVVVETQWHWDEWEVPGEEES